MLEFHSCTFHNCIFSNNNIFPQKNAAFVWGKDKIRHRAITKTLKTMHRSLQSCSLVHKCIRESFHILSSDVNLFKAASKWPDAKSILCFNILHTEILMHHHCSKLTTNNFAVAKKAYHFRRKEIYWNSNKYNIGFFSLQIDDKLIRKTARSKTAVSLLFTPFRITEINNNYGWLSYDIM